MMTETQDNNNLAGNSGKPLSNTEIFGAMDSTKANLQHQVETDKRIDETGRMIAEGAEKIIQTTEDLLKDKNSDEKLQRFLQHAMDFGQRIKEEGKDQVQKISKEEEGSEQEVLKKLKSISEHLRNLLRELVTSSQFRTLLIEMIDLFDKIFTKFSEKTKHLKDDAKKALEENSSSGSLEQAKDSVKEHAKEAGKEIKESVDEHSKETGSDTKDLKEHAKDAGKEIKDSVKEHAKEAGSEIKESVEEHSKETGTDTKNLKERAKEAGRDIKDAAKETHNEVKEQEEDISKSVRSFFSKVGSNKEYKRFVQELYSLFDFLREKKEEHAEELKENTKEIRVEFNNLYEEACGVVGSLVGRDFKGIQNKLLEFYRKIYEDEKIRQYFHDLKKWSDKLMDHPESIDEKEVIDNCKDLLNRGKNDLINEEQKKEMRKIFEELKEVLNSLQNNKYSNSFKKGFQEVQKAFSGSILQALSQTRLLAIPILKGLLTEIPLPRIVGRNSDTSYTLDNLYVRGREITLDDVNFKFKFGIKEVMQLVITIRNIEAVIRSGHFTYFSVGIFNDYEDEGTFTCNLSSKKWKVKWIIQQDKNKPPMLRLADVDGGIDKLNIEIEEAKHKIIDRVALALFSGDIKRRTSDSAENALRNYAQLITQKFNEFFLQKKFYSGRF